MPQGGQIAGLGLGEFGPVAVPRILALLANGNLLITESMQGRAFEVAPDRSIVWEYRNPAEAGYHVLVEEVTRLPESFTAVFAKP